MGSARSQYLVGGSLRRHHLNNDLKAVRNEPRGSLGEELPCRGNSQCKVPKAGHAWQVKVKVMRSTRMLIATLFTIGKM